MPSLTAGVDIGSTTVKAVVLNQSSQRWTSLMPTGTNPSQAGKEVLQIALDESCHSLGDIEYIVATGYGRVSAEFANKTVTEITCHGCGAHFLDPAVRTIIDIGGQDTKVISLGEQGKVIDFAINDKCASGTGRFLDTAAQSVLHVPLEELGKLSFAAEGKAEITSTCTVFAQTEIISLLAAGESVESIAAGLHASIASKVGGMVKRIGVRPLVMMTGGVAKNEGVLLALKQELNTDITLPLEIDSQLVGALGAALIARDIADKKEGNHS